MISLFVSNRHDFSPTLPNLIVCADGRRTHESVMREKPAEEDVSFKWLKTRA